MQARSIITNWTKASRIAESLLLLLGILLSTAMASPPSLRLSESDVDFGEMAQNEVVKTEIRLDNAGGEDLVVSEVYVSCPCTVAEIAADVIPAGGSTVLSVSIHSRDFQGLIDKKVEISSNDPRRPRIELPVRAFIRAPILYEPAERNFDFGEVPRGESATKTVTFHTTELAELKLEALEYDAALFDVQLVGDADPKRATLRVGLAAEAPAGKFREIIRLGTNDPGMPTLDFEANGNVVSHLAVEPDPVNFRFVEPETELNQTLRVFAQGAAAEFTLTGAEIDLPGLEAVVEDPGAGGEGRVIIRGKSLSATDPAAKEKRGRMRGKLRIFTDRPDQAQIEVDVIYLMRM